MRPWSLKMAWRDSRGSRKRLLLFLSSMVLGIAALVSIQSFGVNLRETIDAEARGLLGADLSMESSKPFSEEIELLIDSLGGEQARRVSFTSMALFSRAGTTRLVTVRAVEGGYPFYGEVGTNPPAAARTYLNGPNALVDSGLFEQFGLAVGDSVRIGERAYRIAGALVKTPRESGAVALFSPRIFLPLEHLDPALLNQGSRADYEVYFRFPAGTDIEDLVEEIKPRLEAERVGFDTVGEIKENWNEGLSNLYRFLNLVAFIALLLGGLGVASSVNVYVQQRVETVAILRCLGARSWRTVRIYLIQSFTMGLVGGLLGSAAGLAAQLILPAILRDLLPVEVGFRIIWSAALLGVALGIAVTVLFALLPLARVRRISPMRALRASWTPEQVGRADPLRWLLVLLIAAGVVGFALVQAPTWQIGLGYAGGVAVVFGLLALVARVIMFTARRCFPASWPYVWRQGLANLYRPHNQTVVMLLALGLGTFLIVTLFLVQRTLLAQITVAEREGQPNLVFFDIQPDQLEGVTSMVRDSGLAVVNSVPIVTMRLSAINSLPVDTLKADTTREDSWALTREYRSTYRAHLTETEIVTEGSFVGRIPEDAGDPTDQSGTYAVPVSIEQEIATELRAGIGDTLHFNISGIPIRTVVGSIRQVDWRQLSTNFFIVFPEGALEEAPQFHVVLTRADTPEASAAIQAAIVREFPNVSAFDLALVLGVFNAIFDRVAFVIRFMALFSILTGVVVLAGAVVVSRYQRAEESVLLKTLGASRRQVFRITLVEYLFLGLFSAFTGILLSLVAGWALARFVFETPFVPDYIAIVAAFLGVTSLTVAIGLWNSRGIYDRPVLEVLRAEV